MEKEYVFVSATSPTGAKLRESLTTSTVFLVPSPTASSVSSSSSSPSSDHSSSSSHAAAEFEIDDAVDSLGGSVQSLDASSGSSSTTNDAVTSIAVTTTRSSSSHAGDDSDDAMELDDDLPIVLPYLPALDASTQITTFDGFEEAIADAQQLLDSRLLAYSQYQQMALPEQALLTPRPSTRNNPDGFVMTHRQVVMDRPVTVCMGWQRVSGVDASSRALLQTLEEDGVSYEPHDIAYSVKYLKPVAPFGDCLFLSIEQLLLHTEECAPLTTNGIRAVAMDHFYAHYSASSALDQKKIDTAITNLYFPALTGGWGVSPIQTRRFVATQNDRDALFAQCVSLQDQGFSWPHACEAVYSQYATPVVNAHAYCDYMRVGCRSGASQTHFLIGLNYSRSGLVSVDCDANNERVAWGDDFVIEALATAFARDIFVVLVGCGKMFFLPHRPRDMANDAAAHDEGEKTKGPKGHAPWFLLMRLTGSGNGGDHYEPMLCERLRGDGASEFGCIGD